MTIVNEPGFKCEYFGKLATIDITLGDPIGYNFVDIETGSQFTAEEILIIVDDNSHFLEYCYAQLGAFVSNGRIHPTEPFRAVRWTPGVRIRGEIAGMLYRLWAWGEFRH